MKKKPHILQKVTLILGKISFLLSVVCGIFLYFKIDELGKEHPVSASFLGSMFFFLFVGILLSIIGKADIPDLRIRSIGKKP